MERAQFVDRVPRVLQFASVEAPSQTRHHPHFLIEQQTLHELGLRHEIALNAVVEVLLAQVLGSLADHQEHHENVPLAINLLKHSPVHVLGELHQFSTD